MTSPDGETPVSTLPPKQAQDYAPYLAAAWGFKNHWYPALFSEELPDGVVKGVTICGHEIALRRAKGKVHALSDRCRHRGVRISAKSMCLTDEHLTCWYHGFTYGLEDGILKTIVASPNDPLLGKVRLKVYPVHEVNGMIFVFVGDQTYAPVPLEHDLPAKVTEDILGGKDPIKHPMDKNIWLKGVHRTVRSNWRLGAENGFDPGHVLVHRDNIWIVATDAAMPLGYEPLTEKAYILLDQHNGPKGVANNYEPGHFREVLENPVANIKTYGKTRRPTRVSCWMPGVVMVEHRPIPKWGFYEWFVPIDDKSHEYWSVLIAPAESDEDRKEAAFKYQNFMLPLALGDFNDRDIFAREQMQETYEHGNGWQVETLSKFDGVVLAWRKAAAQFNRGIQEPPYSASTR